MRCSFPGFRESCALARAAPRELKEKLDQSSCCRELLWEAARGEEEIHLVEMWEPQLQEGSTQSQVRGPVRKKRHKFSFVALRQSSAKRIYHIMETRF